MLHSLFAACPELSHLQEPAVEFSSVVQQADLSKVPSVEELLAGPLLAPYAAKAQQTQAAYAPQWEEANKAAYECGLQVSHRVDWVQR
jgi:hypothetical protein